ncbi:uncharacterized protein V1518DRAFT_414613 [Limtongia smithiae]|uniref:uncharacterized protein n=1 Tax=Limtongia smithiae TaxID=1125753 RepID=UPI0034CF8EC8
MRTAAFEHYPIAASTSPQTPGVTEEAAVEATVEAEIEAVEVAMRAHMKQRQHQPPIAAEENKKRQAKAIPQAQPKTKRAKVPKDVSPLSTLVPVDLFMVYGPYGHDKASNSGVACKTSPEVDSTKNTALSTSSRSLTADKNRPDIPFKTAGYPRIPFNQLPPPTAAPVYLPPTPSPPSELEQTDPSLPQSASLDLTADYATAENVLFFRCPVSTCTTKTAAKRSRRAIMRHLRARPDADHRSALLVFSQQNRATMTVRERSRKTSATYREKHTCIAQQRADDVGAPYLAPLFNDVLVKKHKAYVRKKILASLASVPKPSWPVLHTASADSAFTTYTQSMQTNLLFVLHELDQSVYFPPSADIPTLLRDGESYYRGCLQRLETRHPARRAQLEHVRAQLDDPDMLVRASAEFDVWKRDADLARARQKLDRERYEGECYNAAKEMEAWEKERTQCEIERRVDEEMRTWRSRLAMKLKLEWEQRLNGGGVSGPPATPLADMSILDVDSDVDNDNSNDDREDENSLKERLDVVDAVPIMTATRS